MSQNLQQSEESQEDQRRCVVCNRNTPKSIFSCRYKVHDRNLEVLQDFFEANLHFGELCDRCYRLWYKHKRQKQKSSPSSSSPSSTPLPTSNNNNNNASHHPTTSSRSNSPNASSIPSANLVTTNVISNVEGSTSVSHSSSGTSNHGEKAMDVSGNTSALQQRKTNSTQHAPHTTASSNKSSTAAALRNKKLRSRSKQNAFTAKSSNNNNNNNNNSAGRGVKRKRKEEDTSSLSFSTSSSSSSEGENDGQENRDIGRGDFQRKSSSQKRSRRSKGIGNDDSHDNDDNEDIDNDGHGDSNHDDDDDDDDDDENNEKQSGTSKRILRKGTESQHFFKELMLVLPTFSKPPRKSRRKNTPVKSASKIDALHSCSGKEGFVLDKDSSGNTNYCHHYDSEGKVQSTDCRSEGERHQDFQIVNIAQKVEQKALPGSNSHSPSCNPWDATKDMSGKEIPTSLETHKPNIVDSTPNSHGACPPPPSTSLPVRPTTTTTTIAKTSRECDKETDNHLVVDEHNANNSRDKSARSNVFVSPPSSNEQSMNIHETSSKTTYEVFPKTPRQRILIVAEDSGN